jgi:spermidine/putrescine transport system permease protein
MPDSAQSKRPRLRELPVLLTPPLLWLLVFFAVPVAIVLAFGFAQSNAQGEIIARFTLKHFRQALDPLYFTVLVRSLVYAGISTLVTLLLAFPAACFIAFSPPRRQKALLFLVFLPLWTNLLVRLYSFIILLSDGGLLNQVLQALAIIDDPLPLMNTPLAVMTGFVYWNLPFMIPPIFAALDRMNVSLIEASMDLGASRLTTFRNILLPQALPGVAAGVTLCFIPTLGCFIIPDILGGTGTMMIGNLITTQFQQGRNWPFGSALSTLLMLLVLLGISLYLRFYDPTRQPAAEGA